ncbi:pentapeptide repeat-containing protein [Nucisporomicrobium flavum]|uniref:pentapeptide repeat-containing protein n=1 Tax=Nucisporomicrobium flavum TaxID=2785915 RepID=UPI0018F6F5CD|nr:pentapeptide repeat-containing protein [Nucisporomicrobium flavum]
MQGQVADRFTAAFDQLGQEDDKKQDKLSIRLGGIYALQRLMIDSPPDEPAAVQVLCAFVRTHAPLAADPPKAVPPAPADVRAALTVLGHRPNPSAHVLDPSNTLLGLDHVDLAGADLAGADLTSADLSGATLTGADLGGAELSRANLNGVYPESGANLTGADLCNATLSGADLRRAELGGADLSRARLAFADLREADLDSANLSGASLGDARLDGASLGDARLDGAYLSGADLRDATGVTSQQLARTWLDGLTRFPAGVSAPAPAPPR